MLLFWSSVATVSVLSGLADDEPTRWRTGRELATGVEIGISGSWTDTPLRSLLQQLSRRQRIALFIDRRVDPTVRVNLVTQDSHWEQLLLKIGEPHGYFFCQLGNIYYFGPRDVCLTLPEVYQHLREDLLKRRGDLQVNWLSPVPASWPRLSQPAQMLEALGRQYGIELYSAAEIGHDVWAEWEGPPVPLFLKALLLTTGFGKTIVVSKTGRKMKIVAYPTTKRTSWSVKSLADAKRAIRDIQLDHKGVEMKAVSRSQAILSGTTSLLYPAIVEMIDRQQAIGSSEPARFTLQLRGTRGAALATLANQLNVEFEHPTAAREILSEFIERNFQDALPAEIISGVLEGTPLNYRLDEKRLQIH